MKRVLKYPIEKSFLVAPAGEVLLVGHQGGDLPTIWIAVEDDAHKVAYRVIGTGWPIDPHWVHVGSAICGQFVWHVFREDF